MPIRRISRGLNGRRRAARTAPGWWRPPQGDPGPDALGRPWPVWGTPRIPAVARLRPPPIGRVAGCVRDSCFPRGAGASIAVWCSSPRRGRTSPGHYSSASSRGAFLASGSFRRTCHSTILSLFARHTPYFCLRHPGGQSSASSLTEVPSPCCRESPLFPGRVNLYFVTGLKSVLVQLVLHGN